MRRTWRFFSGGNLFCRESQDEASKDNLTDESWWTQGRVVLPPKQRMGWIVSYPTRCSNYLSCGCCLVVSQYSEPELSGIRSYSWAGEGFGRGIRGDFRVSARTDWLIGENSVNQQGKVIQTRKTLSGVYVVDQSDDTSEGMTELEEFLLARSNVIFRVSYAACALIFLILFFFFLGGKVQWEVLLVVQWLLWRW